MMRREDGENQIFPASPLPEQKEAGGVERERERRRDGENSSQGVVWCGCAVQRIVGRVEVQRCCHGDTLHNQSWW